MRRQSREQAEHEAAKGATPEACAREIMEVVPPVMRFIRTQMRRHSQPSLSIPQFRSLAFLSRCPGASLSAVADHLGVTPPTASALVERLVRRGLVMRAVAPDERRRVELRLTPSGHEHLEQARSATRSYLATLLSTLPPAELHALSRGLGILREALKDVAFDRNGGCPDGRADPAVRHPRGG